MTKCSERFLRSCMWGARHLPEKDQVEIILRRACQKLRKSTEVGCFTDPVVTAKYIERCFGKEVWDAVREEVRKASDIGDIGLLCEDYAFGSTLPQDIVLLNDIFSDDTEVYRYLPKGEIKPALYKHGKRRASGLRNTYACRSARAWVMAEYNAACQDAVRGGVPVDPPYVWLTKEIARVTAGGTEKPQPIYTDMVDGKIRPKATEPSDLMGQLTSHYGYVAGIYDILCHLVTKRLIPDFKDDAGAKWHNVWYYHSQLFPISATNLNQFASVSPLELVYIGIMRQFAFPRRERGLRVTYNIESRVETTIMKCDTIKQELIHGIKNGDYRLGCEILETLLEDKSKVSDIIDTSDTKGMRAAFRGAMRTYCYTDFVVKDLPNYVARSLHGPSIADYMIKYPTSKVVGVVRFERAYADSAKYPTHNYLLVHDCIDGDSLAVAIENVMPASCIQMVYVGANDKPSILLKSAEKKDLLLANLVLFDYDTCDFVPITDDLFKVGESLVMSGMMNDVISSTGMFGDLPLAAEEQEKLRAIDGMASWALIYDAMKRIEEEDDTPLIRMDDPTTVRRRDYHAPTLPMVDALPSPVDKTPIGSTTQLAIIRLRPFYALARYVDAWYGLSSFGGAEIIVDYETDRALLLKKSLFLSILGLGTEWIRYNVLYAIPTYARNYADIVVSMRMCESWKDGVEIVADKIREKELVIGPVSLYNLRTHTMTELKSALERLTWSMTAIYQVRRLVFHEEGAEDSAVSESTTVSEENGDA